MNHLLSFEAIEVSIAKCFGTNSFHCFTQPSGKGRLSSSVIVVKL